jgi:sodium-dependent dicarboxylate transporter 2/3/5
MFVPILAGISHQMGMGPASFVVIPTIAISMTFLLPPGTAPNAIVHGKGGVSTKEMFKAGILPTVFAVVLIFAFSLLFVGRI